MANNPLLWAEARLAGGWTALLPQAILPAAAALHALLWQERPATPYEVLRVFELGLPLAAGLAAAHLMTIETDEGFDELRRSYPEPALRLPMLRTLAGLWLGLLALALGLGAFRLAYGPFDAAALAGPALAPALYLLALALLAGNLTRSYWAAAGLVMGYWFLEVQTRGGASGALFLFQATWPREGIDLAFNRALLAAFGLILLLLNAWLSAERRRGWGLKRGPG